MSCSKSRPSKIEQIIVLLPRCATTRFLRLRPPLWRFPKHARDLRRRWCALCEERVPVFRRIAAGERLSKHDIGVGGTVVRTQRICVVHPRVDDHTRHAVEPIEEPVAPVACLASEPRWPPGIVPPCRNGPAPGSCGILSNVGASSRAAVLGRPRDFYSF